MSGNITYQSEELVRFYQHHRRRWNELYPSERWVFERVLQDRDTLGHVLDVGCATGGLGNALSERFHLESYVGVDINAQVIEVARREAASIPAKTDFHVADICECQEIGGGPFDLVTALSSVDWNVDVSGNLRACWAAVAPGGRLVLSVRLTPAATVCDIARSYQRIWFDPEPIPDDAERAAYNVFNTSDAIRMLTQLSPAPSHLLAYGYWGKPAVSANTLYQRVIFTVFAVRKPRLAEPKDDIGIEAHLPVDAFLG